MKSSKYFRNPLVAAVIIWSSGFTYSEAQTSGVLNNGVNYTSSGIEQRYISISIDCTNINNSYSCAMAREVALLEKYPNIAMRNQSELMLFCKNGRKYIFSNYLPKEGEAQNFDTVQGYALIGYYPDKNVYLLMRQYYEDIGFDIVSAVDGTRESGIESQGWEGPLLSPDGRQLLSMDCTHGNGKTKLISLNNWGHTKIQAEFSNRLICDDNPNILPKWKDNKTIILFGVDNKSSSQTILNFGEIKNNKGKWCINK